jgi:hypothetical protein
MGPRSWLVTIIFMLASDYAQSLMGSENSLISYYELFL